MKKLITILLIGGVVCCVNIPRSIWYDLGAAVCFTTAIFVDEKRTAPDLKREERIEDLEQYEP